jgi:hypothetical protein
MLNQPSDVKFLIRPIISCGKIPNQINKNARIKIVARLPK